MKLTGSIIKKGSSNISIKGYRAKRRFLQIFFITFALTWSLFIVNFAPVYGQTTVKTSAFIGIEPNPVQVISPETDPTQVGPQNLSVLVTIRIEPAPPTPKDVFHNITVTYINADGTHTLLSRHDTNSDGSQKFTMAKTERPGNYIYVVSFPGKPSTVQYTIYPPKTKQC